MIYVASDAAGNQATPQVRQVFVATRRRKLTIQLESPEAKLAGEEVAVPVRGRFEGISSLQFSLEWDPTKIRLIKEVQNGVYGPKLSGVHSKLVV